MKEPDTNNQDAELEQQMTASMRVDNEDVPYPDTDAWHNLGQQTRARASQHGIPRKRILRALMWPAAAAVRGAAPSARPSRGSREKRHP